MADDFPRGNVCFRGVSISPNCICNISETLGKVQLDVPLIMISAGGFWHIHISQRVFEVIQNPSGFGVFRQISHRCIKDFFWNCLSSEKSLSEFRFFSESSQLGIIFLWVTRRIPFTMLTASTEPFKGGGPGCSEWDYVWPNIVPRIQSWTRL